MGKGQCIEHYGSAEAYLPVLEALGRLCRGAEGEQLIALLNQYAPTWLVQMPALLDATELEALQRKTQGATREQMLRELAEALEVITAERLLILVLEDLHWSDPSTLDLLAMVARRTEPARLLILGTYRPIDVIVHEHPLKTVKAELQLHGHCQEWALELLSEAAITDYLSARFQVPSPFQACPEPSRRREGQGEGNGHEVWQRLAQILHHRTEGNPLFLVAMVEDLITRSVIMQTDTGWEIKAAPTETRIPDSIRQLVTLQSERLSPDIQQTLKAASIAGMEFSAAAVAAALVTETVTIERHCEQLAQHQHFLRRVGVEEWPDGTLAARYSFLHALYQQLWHERVSPTQLQHYHLRIGERKELAYGDRVSETASELALHFEQAHDYHKAVRYLRHAGRGALQRSAHQESITLFTRGVELLTLLPYNYQRDQDELRLQIHLGTAFITAKGYGVKEVEQAYTRAYELSQRLGTSPQLFAILGGLCSLYLERLELTKSHEFANQMLRYAHAAQDPILLVWAHRTLGTILYHTGEFLLARHHYEKSLTLYESQQHCAYGYAFDPGITGLSQLAWTLFWLGYPDQALQHSREGVRLAQKLSHPLSLMMSLGSAAVLHRWRGEQHLAQELEERGHALATAQGFPQLMLEGSFEQGAVLVTQGQAQQGIEQIHQGLVTLRARGSELNRPYYLLLLAAAYGKIGQTDTGLNIVAEALALVTTHSELLYEADAYRLKGELILQQSGVRKLTPTVGKSQILDVRSQDEAEEYFMKALSVARKQQAKSLELRAVMSLARLWQSQGKKKQDHNLLSDIYNWFTEGFDTKDLREAKALLESLEAKV